MSSKLKVAVVGTGHISNWHMPGWRASEHAEVVAGADTNPALLKSWGAQYDISRLTTSVNDVLSDPGIDIIDICAPNMHHTALTVAALAAGKHVLCEKPLAPTPAEVRQMIEARDRSGKLLMTAQHFRFSGISQAIKREIAAGELGDVYHTRAWMLRRNNWIPTPTFTDKALSGGGACIDIGVHVLDLALWMMGNPAPVAVSGVARAGLAHHPGQFSTWRNMPFPETFNVEDFAAAFVRFDSGATLMLEVSWMLHHDIEGEDMQIWLYGTEGGCHYPKAEFLASQYDRKQMSNRVLKRTKDALEPHAQECVEFARAIANGAPSPVPPEQSLQVMSILDGIYRSQREGREVRIEA